MAKNVYVCLECREVISNEGLPPMGGGARS